MQPWEQMSSWGWAWAWELRFGFSAPTQVSIMRSAEERSPNDISLGTPLPGGGSKQGADGADGGIIANAGFGFTLGNGFDLRLELPIIFFFRGVGAPQH